MGLYRCLGVKKVGNMLSYEITGPNGIAIKCSSSKSMEEVDKEIAKAIIRLDAASPPRRPTKSTKPITF